MFKLYIALGVAVIGLSACGPSMDCNDTAAKTTVATIIVEHPTEFAPADQLTQFTWKSNKVQIVPESVALTSIRLQDKNHDSGALQCAANIAFETTAYNHGYMDMGKAFTSAFTGEKAEEQQSSLRADKIEGSIRYLLEKNADGGIHVTVLE